MNTATFFRIVLSAVLILLLSSPAPGQSAKSVVIAGEDAPVPGAATIVPCDLPAPPAVASGRSIAQMPGFPISLGIDTILPPSRGLVFADLDGDGTLEIIASNTDRMIHAWDYRGRAMPGFPVTTSHPAQSAPSVGDLDGDGDLEILQCVRGFRDGGGLYGIDHEGKALPGFPVSLSNHIFTGSPTLFDLDDDGDLEIVVGERWAKVGALHVFEKDGTEWGGAWPVSLRYVPTGSPAVGDADGDGKPEIFVLTHGEIALLERNGSVAPGWPKQIAGGKFNYQSPALADLDGDGDLEIVVTCHKTAAGCYVFHHDGKPFPGWPKPLGTWSFCAPTVTDLEGDGSPEIIDGRLGKFSVPSVAFAVWSAAGVLRPGFPYTIASGGGSEGPLTAADIDGDGVMEIFADHNVIEGPPGDLKGFLFGVDASGNDLPGFPLRPRGFTHMNGATIGDVDGDGDIELGLLTFDTYVEVNLYDLPGSYHPGRVGWEAYHGHARRGGLDGGEDRLHLTGPCTIGGTIRVFLHGKPGERAFLRVSRGTARRHFPPLGWNFLDPGQFLGFNIHDRPIPAAGEIAVSLPIPNNPGLVGREFYFQGLIGPNPLGGAGRMTNLVVKRVH